MGLVFLIFGLIALLSKRIVVTRHLVLEGRAARWFGLILVSPFFLSLAIGMVVRFAGESMSENTRTGTSIALYAGAICAATVYAISVFRRRGHIRAHESNPAALPELATACASSHPISAEGPRVVRWPVGLLVLAFVCGVGLLAWYEKHSDIVGHWQPVAASGGTARTDTVVPSSANQLSEQSCSNEDQLLAELGVLMNYMNSQDVLGNPRSTKAERAQAQGQLRRVKEWADLILKDPTSSQDHRVRAASMLKYISSVK